MKIGTATDPLARLATLQAGCPVELVIRATTKGGQAYEQRLHDRFRAQRRHGEWFEPTPELEAVAGVRLCFDPQTGSNWTANRTTGPDIHLIDDRAAA